MKDRKTEEAVKQTQKERKQRKWKKLSKTMKGTGCNVIQNAVPVLNSQSVWWSEIIAPCILNLDAGQT